MINTLSVASDGYLFSGDHQTLTIISGGYLDILSIPEIIIKTVIKGGGGETRKVRYQKNNLNNIKKALSKKEQHLKHLSNEDEEIFTIIKMFLHCHYFKE